jgi:two-component system sensor histidine kinase AdeS
MKLPRWFRSFGGQLAIAIGATIAISAALIIFLTDLRDSIETAQYVSSLSPDEQQIFKRVSSGDFSSPEDVEKLYKRVNVDNESRELNARLFLYSLILVAMTGAMTAAVLVANHFTKPIIRVASAARRVAEGDLAARAVPTRFMPAEIGSLLHDFNQMAFALERSHHDLKVSNAAIAHELRTPLTVLRGRLQGMLDGVFRSGESEISALMAQVEQISRIVEDLRILSLANTGRLHLDIKSFNLAAELSLTLAGVEPDLNAVGLKLHTEIDQIELQADALRIRQALLALLENAKHYASTGGEVTVTASVIEKNVRISVMDRGPGLDDNAKLAAFDRFWRADESRSRGTGGSGLGLSVVQAIAEAHGGQARLCDRIGGGLIVEMVFPLERQ